MRCNHSRSIFGVSLLSLSGFVLLASSGMDQTVRARQATPTAPPAIACDIAPVSVPEILAQLEPLPEDGSPFLAVLPPPPGTPADATTTAEIAAVVQEFEACANAGDQLRILALFSNDLFAQPMREATLAELTAELTAVASQTPAPIPAGKRLVLIGPWDVQMLDDGRVRAAVLFTQEEGADPYPSSTKAVLFVHHDERWLIEEMTQIQIIEECGEPVIIAAAAGPPPGATFDSWPAHCDEDDRDNSRKKRRDRLSTPTAEAG